MEVAICMLDRKEMAGSLDDEQIHIITDEILHLRTLERRTSILKSTKEQGKKNKKFRAAI